MGQSEPAGKGSHGGRRSWLLALVGLWLGCGGGGAKLTDGRSPRHAYLSQRGTENDHDGAQESDGHREGAGSGTGNVIVGIEHAHAPVGAARKPRCK